MSNLKHQLFLFVFFLPACSTFCQQHHFIKLKFEAAADNDKIYITSAKSGRDSSCIKNREARFYLPATEKEWMWYSVIYRNNKTEYYSLLFHNAASDITLSVDSAFSHYTILGDSTAAIQNDFNEGLFTLWTQLKSLEEQLSKTTDSIKQTSLKAAINSFDQRYHDYSINWVSKHRSDPFSVAVIFTYIDRTNRWHTLDTVAAHCFDQLLPAAKMDNYQAYVMQRHWSMYSEKYALMQDGLMAPSFSIKDTAGNDFSLEKFRGKWLLVDFWASWCGPCRQNNPLLKAFAAKYGGRGLEVLSISVDPDESKWKNAITKDRMTWHQGCDLKGLDAGVGKLYGVGAVPVYYLVSPDGRIVKRSLGGDIGEMEKALSKTIVF